MWDNPIFLKPESSVNDDTGDDMDIKKGYITITTEIDMDIISCPFCGNCFFGITNKQGGFQVICHKCECIGPPEKSQKMAVIKWNQRAKENINEPIEIPRPKI